MAIVTIIATCAMNEVPFLFHIPNKALGNCLGASIAYEKGLRQSGRAYREVTVNGYKGLLAHADPDAERAIRGRRKYIIHRLTKTGGRYIDWTARQFDKRVPYPLVMTRRELQALWHWEGPYVVGPRRLPL